jgi:hypothetical protein
MIFFFCFFSFEEFDQIHPIHIFHLSRQREWILMSKPCWMHPIKRQRISQRKKREREVAHPPQTREEDAVGPEAENATIAPIAILTADGMSERIVDPLVKTRCKIRVADPIVVKGIIGMSENIVDQIIIVVRRVKPRSKIRVDITRLNPRIVLPSDLESHLTNRLLLKRLRHWSELAHPIGMF